VVEGLELLGQLWFPSRLDGLLVVRKPIRAVGDGSSRPPSCRRSTARTGVAAACSGLAGMEAGLQECVTVSR
jgi:hypothetical protein